MPAAAVAAVAAIAIGIWAVGLSRDLNDAKDELAVLGDPNAQVFETANGEANLVVTPNGEAALVVRRLAPAPEGKDYEIWVFENGVPKRAGLFERPGVAMSDAARRAGTDGGGHRRARRWSRRAFRRASLHRIFSLTRPVPSE